MSEVSTLLEMLNNASFNMYISGLRNHAEKAFYMGKVVALRNVFKSMGITLVEHVAEFGHKVYQVSVDK